VFGRAIMRSPAGTACLPCGLHLKQVTCLASKLLSGRKRTCCNVTRELMLKLDWGMQLRERCVVVLSFGSVFEEGGCGFGGRSWMRLGVHSYARLQGRRVSLAHCSFLWSHVLCGSSFSCESGCPAMRHVS